MKLLLKKIALFLAIAILLDQFFGFCLEQLADRVSFDFRARNRMKEFYNYKEKLDILFLGSSHAYMGFNPYIFDKALNVNSFNLGSSGQYPILSYYILKEALRIGQKPNLVIMEVYWGVLKKHDQDYDYSSYVYRNMKFSMNKLSLLRSAFKFPSVLKLLSRFFNDRYIIELCAKYFSGEDVGRYLGKGYVEYTSKVSMDSISNVKTDFSGIELEFGRLSYLEEIIKLAKDNGIGIVFISSPMPPTIFRNSQGYMNIYKTIKNIADKNKIDFFDYSILNDKLQIITDRDFKDSHHLNKQGVEIFNKHVIQGLVSIYGQGFWAG